MFLSLFSSWSAHNNSIFFKSNLFETTALPHSLAASAQNAFQVKWRVYALDKQINAMDLSEKATIFTIQFIQFATKLCKFVYPFVIEILLWKQRKCTKDKNTQISNEILPSPLPLVQPRTPLFCSIIFLLWTKFYCLLNGNEQSSSRRKTHAYTSHQMLWPIL